jgi:uncharacterized protein (DUF58 family)
MPNPTPTSWPLTAIDPAILAGIEGLDLIAKTVVDGFVAGLHRSPDFGFSQEFAEYRAYSPGDDLRHVDWNVFARTERAYLKRYRGETNSQLTILLDASNSMKFASQPFGSKLDYARYLAAALVYLGLHHQRDAAGLIVFDEVVREFIHPSTRPGQLGRLFGALENVTPRARTDFSKPLAHFQQFLHRRGFAIVISDFYAPPEEIIATLAPLRHHGNEVVLFHLLDPLELNPNLREAVLLEDLETNQRFEVTPDYARNEYQTKFQAHRAALKDAAQSANLDYHLLPTDRPLDHALREYLTLRARTK